MSILETIKVLGFGSAFGAGVGAWLYLAFPDALPGCKSVDGAMLAGALVGAGFCQLIDRFVVGWLIRPVSRQTSFYFRLLEIWALRPVTSKSFRQKLTRKLVEKHLLGDLDSKQDKF